MQKFVTTLLTPYQHNLASKYFPEPVIKSEKDIANESKKRAKLLGKSKVSVMMRLGIAFMPLWILFCIVYIFLRGILLGPQKSKRWLNAYFMTMFNRVSNLVFLYYFLHRCRLRK